MKILAVKLSSMGDLFHALPAVHNLKIGLAARIDWVVNEEYVELVKCFDDVDRVVPFSRKAFLSTLGPFLRELRSETYDCVIDFQGLMKSALITVSAAAPRRIGPSFHRECSRLFYTEVAGRRDKDRHAVEENLDVVRHLGVDLLEPRFPVSFPDRCLDDRHPRVGFVPSSRWPSKNWPVNCYVDLAKRLKTTVDATVFLFGGPADAPVCDAVEKGVGEGVVNLAGRIGLVELGAYLKEMDLLVANDSGPVHMAAAIGTPALVVFGPTDPKRTGPYGAQHRVATTSIPCRPCFSRSCKRPGVPCLEGVTPERVSETALEMLRA